VQQSRSLKNAFNKRLIQFFYSTAAEKPFYSFKAPSKYSFDDIVFPFSSTSYNEKSLTTHINEGKIF
jgi:hypothetical protein